MSETPAVDCDALWNKIAPIFSNGAFMRPRFGASLGVASRAGPKRMQLLTGSKPAKRLAPLVENLTTRDLADLIVRSDLNLDQANAGLRLTLIANISVPIGTVVLINQMAPGYLGSIVDGAPAVAVLLPLAAALSWLTGIIWYAYAGVAAARDLNHLLRLRYSGIAVNPLQMDDEDGDALGEAIDIV